MALASLEEARKHLADKDTLVWLDFEGVLGEAGLEMLRATFDFHDLALEDAAKPTDGEASRQRPKIEEYDDYFFLVMQALSSQIEDNLVRLSKHEIDLFAGANYVVTVHQDDIPELDAVWRDAQKRPGLMSCGSDRLVYHLVDAVVDHYLEIVDGIEDVLDELGDTVIDPRYGRDAVRDIFTLKRELINFRRAAAPLRDVINQMTTRNFPFVNGDTQPYLRDVYDHLIRLSDMLDTYRDILTGALDVHLSAVSNSLNLVMKRLTVVATIFMPLGFITGFWGMNFTDFMPLENSIWWWGSIMVMFLLTIGMVIYLSYSWVRKWM